MGRDVQQALDEMSKLAQWIYPSQLELGGLAAALRSAAVTAGVPASVDVTAGANYPPEVARTISMCWLEVLDQTGGETPAAITVREEAEALTFEIAGDGPRSDARLEQLCDRVEALGGVLTIASEPDRISGSFPLSR